MRSLTKSQGWVVRALTTSLAGNSHADPVIEEAEVAEWSSLTFTGERHRLVLRLDSLDIGDVSFAPLDVSGTVVAVERVDQTATGTGVRLSISLLAIAVAGEALAPGLIPGSK